MKRRDFVKGVSLGTAAGAVLPGLACTSEKNESGLDNNGNHKKSKKLNYRNEAGELIERYSYKCPPRSGIALGGIGTGSVELRKDGRFYNWSIFNNYPKGTGPAFELKPGREEDLMASNLFFTVRYQIEDEEPRLKLLQINDDLNEGGMTGIIYYFPWMEAVQNIEYKARFPFVKMKFTDETMPFDIEMEAFSPFIPHDLKNASLPLVYFDFKIIAKTNKKVNVMLMASLRNNVGYEDPERYFVTTIEEGENHRMINMTCEGMDKKASTWGQQVIASLDKSSTYYSGWVARHPYYEYVLRNSTLPNIDDTDGVESILKTLDEVPEWMPTTKGRNVVDKSTGKKKVYTDKEGNAYMNSTIAMSANFSASGEEFAHSFLMSWNFPNLYAENSDKIEGHYYTNFFGSAIEVAKYGIKNKEDLKNRSDKFLNDFFNSTAPEYVLEQINSQLNTFITSGRLVKDKYFGVQEGLAAHNSWGPIATTDVSLYGSVPIISLFPELQKKMMEAHALLQDQNPHGEIAHGLHKNFKSWEDGTAGISHRRDLPGQFIIMVLRDFFWTNDKKYLEAMWPRIKRAIDYAISDDLDRNGDQMPDMIGNRSSYDNFPMFGLSSYIQSQWLCTMASATEAARVMGDDEARIKYSNILNDGAELMDKHLWNGKYYRLYNDYDNSIGKNYSADEGISHWDERKEKDEGCMTDQIIGQWAAHLSGLGHLFDENHIRQALMSILEMSYKEGFGLRNASWPDTKFWGDVPANMWVDQGNTLWTGVELEFASFLIFEGFVDEGFKVIKTVDERYRKAGLYWDHQEFGGHYYRPMSAWAILNAMLGFYINQGEYGFDPKLNDNNFKLFFTFPEGTAHYSAKNGEIEITLLSGQMTIHSLVFNNHGLSARTGKLYLDNNIEKEVEIVPGQVKIEFEKSLVAKSGQTIKLV